MSKLPRMDGRFHLSAWLLAGLVLASDPAGAELARVHVARDASMADVLRIRDNLRSFGADVKGFARGPVFVVDLPLAAIEPARSVHGVDKVQLLQRSGEAAARAAITSGLANERARRGLFPGNGNVQPPAAIALSIERSLLRSPSIAPNAHSRLLSALQGVGGPPRLVDNSLSPHFPPIGEQEGRNSCVAWAAGYYWSTYTQAADEGLDVSGEWLPRDPPCDILTDGVFDPAKFALCLPTIKDPPRPSRATEHIASPAFIYPLIRFAGTDSNGNPTEDGGSELAYAMVRLNTWGIGSWQMKPYDPWRFDSVVLQWPDEAQWLEALPRRTQQTVRLTISQDADFAALKQHLANGNLATVGFTHHENYQTWGWDKSCQSIAGACPGVSGDVVFSTGGTRSLGRHAVAIVGYHDDKSYVDADGVERRGALLMANSASPYWGTTNTAGGSLGYFWMAYDFARRHLEPVYYNVDRSFYRPRLVAVAHVQSANRAASKLSAGIGLQAETAGPVPLYSNDVYPSTSSLSVQPLAAGSTLVLDLSDGYGHLWRFPGLPLLHAAWSGPAGSSLGPLEFRVDLGATGDFTRWESPEGVKTVAGGSDTTVVLCTDAPPNADINASTTVDRLDVMLVTNALYVRTRPQCRADPRDADRDGRITILDARKVAAQCDRANCAPR